MSKSLRRSNSRRKGRSPLRSKRRKKTKRKNEKALKSKQINKPLIDNNGINEMDEMDEMDEMEGGAPPKKWCGICGQGYKRQNYCEYCCAITIEGKLCIPAWVEDNKFIKKRIIMRDEHRKEITDAFEIEEITNVKYDDNGWFKKTNDDVSIDEVTSIIRGVYQKEGYNLLRVGKFSGLKDGITERDWKYKLYKKFDGSTTCIDMMKCFPGQNKRPEPEEEYNYKLNKHILLFHRYIVYKLLFKEHNLEKIIPLYLYNDLKKLFYIYRISIPETNTRSSEVLAVYPQSQSPQQQQQQQQQLNQRQTLNTVHGQPS